jgi:transposase
VKNSTAERLKQVPDGCLIVGVDPHKKKHVVVSMTLDARVSTRRKFDNTRAGFTGLTTWAKEEAAATGSRSIMFAIEAGGHYWRNLAYYLDGGGLALRLVSPFTLKRRREGEDLNRRKNDYRDAEMAAEIMRTGQFLNTRLPYGIWAELRAAHAAYQRLVKESSRTKNTLLGLLDGVFPDFTGVFKNPCGKTALAVLSEGITPEVIASMEPMAYIDLVRRHFQGRGLAVKKLKELHCLAGVTSGIREGAGSVVKETTFLAKRLSLIMTQVKEATDCLLKLVSAIPDSRSLLSIRGIGYITVAGILAELGPLTSYQNARQLIKMAGTNPTQAESAGKSASHTPMSKKGRSGLRWVLWSAAANLIRLNEEFRSWAKALRERPAPAHPLHRREVIGAVCNRLLRLVYALVIKGDLYRQRQMVSVA